MGGPDQVFLSSSGSQRSHVSHARSETATRSPSRIHTHTGSG
jgi:hypothetical protein